jgi:hypothetical protein
MGRWLSVTMALTRCLLPTFFREYSKSQRREEKPGSGERRIWRGFKGNARGASL